MKRLMLLTAIMFITTGLVKAQNNKQQMIDEKEIRQVVANIEAAWAAGDGKKFAENFTEDSDFTVWNGMYMYGREANEKGHQQIFDTFYKGTEVRTEIRKIRFLSNEIAVVHLQAEMFKDGKKKEDVPKVVLLMIFQKQEGKWKIVVFQNTPIINRGELVVGRTAENKEENRK